jgi:hypothetical protein
MAEAGEEALVEDSGVAEEASGGGFSFNFRGERLYSEYNHCEQR